MVFRLEYFPYLGSPDHQTISSVGRMFVVLALFFGGFFLLNMYFRIKVWKCWRVMSRNGVHFAASDIFSTQKMAEVVALYPEHEQDILSFARHMRYSIWMASVFVVLIIIFGAALM